MMFPIKKPTFVREPREIQETHKTYHTKDFIFKYCKNCDHYHSNPVSKQKTLKTQQTQSLQIQESCIFDLQMRLHSLIQDDIIQSFSYVENSLDEKGTNSTASNSLQLSTQTSNKKIIKLRPKRVALRERQE